MGHGHRRPRRSGKALIHTASSPTPRASWEVVHEKNDLRGCVRFGRCTGALEACKVWTSVWEGGQSLALAALEKETGHFPTMCRRERPWKR